MDTDRGAAECLGYVLLLVGAVSLLLTRRGSRRRTVHCVLAVFLLTLLVDDMFEMHEYVGALVGERAGLRPIAGIGPPTLGSWAMWGMIIGPFILAFILTWEHSRPRVRPGGAGRLPARVRPLLPGSDLGRVRHDHRQLFRDEAEAEAGHHAHRLPVEVSGQRHLGRHVSSRGRPEPECVDVLVPSSETRAEDAPPP